MHIMQRKTGCDRLMWDGIDIYHGPFERSDEWLPRIRKLDNNGTYLWAGTRRSDPPKGWPTPREILDEIDKSQALAEKYANHPNAACINDFVGAAEMLAGFNATKKSE